LKAIWQRNDSAMCSNTLIELIGVRGYLKARKDVCAMKRPVRAILVMAVTAASVAGTLAAPAQAATSPNPSNPTARPISSVQYDGGGLHVTVLKYAQGVRPSNVSPGPCSINSDVGFGVESQGTYEVYCYVGHGTRNINLYGVETVFAYQNTSGEYDHGPNNGNPCDRVQDFGEYYNTQYDPLAHICWLELA
jgi:hypothetical protein